VKVSEAEHLSIYDYSAKKNARVQLISIRGCDVHESERERAFGFLRPKLERERTSVRLATALHEQRV
jgi:hypothetical protein